MNNKSRPPMGTKNHLANVISDVCPHQHFKSDVIDRNILSRKQHLNLLCTPKGYRWMIKKVDRSKMKGPDGVPEPCKLSKKKPGKTYVHNILAELWDLITPEMVQRMRDMLVTEFGLSEEAALDFICHSRYDSSLTADRMAKGSQEEGVAGHKDDRPPEGSTIPCLAAAQKLCKNDFNIDVNPFHIREFSKAFSSKVSGYVAAMTCAKRDSKHRIMAEAILRGLCDLTGEETTLDSPKNRLHKILTVTSDRLALLLAGNVEDEEKRRANRRKIEDKVLKKKTLARLREQKRRQKEKDRIQREKEKNRKRRAEEEEEKRKLADEEKERKKAEREKRHQEMEKFREEEKQKQKEEMKKVKGESGAAQNKGGQAEGDRSKPASKNRGHQAGGDRSKQTVPKPGQSYRPKNEQPNKDGPKGQLGSKTGAPLSNNAKGPQASKTASAVSNQNKQNTQANKSGATDSNQVKATSSNQPVKEAGSRPEVQASESLAGGTNENESRSAVQGSERPAGEKSGTIASQGGEAVAKTASYQNDLSKDTSKLGQLASKSAVWGDERIKNVASAFSRSGKMTPATSQSTSLDKLVDILTSQGKAASKIPRQEEPMDAAGLNPQNEIVPQLSQGILGGVTRSQGKLTSEQTPHAKLGTYTTSEDRLTPTEKKRRDTILAVKRTFSDHFNVQRTSYDEAKQKIGAAKRKSSSRTLPPKMPFDPVDQKSLAQWLDYATQMAEEWSRWIDKTIQDTEDKAILYKSKEKEGKTQPEDVEDWNRFVERTNEDAKRWRRQRKAMMESTKEWKHQ